MFDCCKKYGFRFVPFFSKKLIEQKSFRYISFAGNFLFVIDELIECEIALSSNKKFQLSFHFETHRNLNEFSGFARTSVRMVVPSQNHIRHI